MGVWGLPDRRFHNEILDNNPLLGENCPGLERVSKCSCCQASPKLQLLAISH
jgi:hypothetical protein